MVRSTVADVDLDAIAHNLKTISAFLQAEPRESGAPAPGIVAVVKANAYGHGAVPVAQALEKAGATMLACADIEEAVTLRRAGIGVEILVFGALGVSDVSGVFDYRLTPTISTPSAGRALQAAAAARGVTAALSPEDRHGHESARAALRQSAANVAGADREREPADRRPLHALRDRRQSRTAR